MLQFTDTQLIILSAASQRMERRGAANERLRRSHPKCCAKAHPVRLLQEVRAGSLPIWQRDEQRDPMALRITKDSLAALDVEDGAAVPEGGPSLSGRH